MASYLVRSWASCAFCQPRHATVQTTQNVGIVGQFGMVEKGSDSSSLPALLFCLRRRHFLLSGYAAVNRTQVSAAFGYVRTGVLCQSFGSAKCVRQVCRKACGQERLKRTHWNFPSSQAGCSSPCRYLFSIAQFWPAMARPVP